MPRFLPDKLSKFIRGQSTRSVIVDETELISIAGLLDKRSLEKIRAEFDPEYYYKNNPDVKEGKIDALFHFLSSGHTENRDPNADFDLRYYRRKYRRELVSGSNPFIHFVLEGRSKGNRPAPSSRKKKNNITSDVEIIRSAFDIDFYLQQYDDVRNTGVDPVEHYCRSGWQEGRDPSPIFSTKFYLDQYADVNESQVNPLAHYLTRGKQEGRAGSLAELQGQPAVALEPNAIDGSQLPADISAFEYSLVLEKFDHEYYRTQSDIPTEGEDLVIHFLRDGWKANLDPSAEFSVRHYLSSNQDVADSGVNPFVHYLSQGHSEGREPLPPGGSMLRNAEVSLAAEHAFFANAGPEFEDHDPAILKVHPPKAKALAYYLPQFHSIEENDRWWGEGFTEWRNVGRGLPRFSGHFQPRIPRDLGFYDLSDVEVMRRQADLARASGIFGFSFYYYNFNGQRLLEKPTEQFLAEPSIDFPFCITWANENWTRTWDGFDRDVLMAQDYRPEDDQAFLADIARHFADPRYIRLNGRPLFIIYRPGIIPDPEETIARWRKQLNEAHNEDPFILMVQGFGDEDPRVFGLDGAIEFPPHKVAADLPPLNSSLYLHDTSFEGHVVDYKDVVEKSRDESTSEFPLIKGVTQSWDNEARRPGRGMVLHGGTPAAYEEWLRDAVDYSLSNPIENENFVVVNAWNEWAEGAYLEPDVHFGSAYLNATARAISQAPRKRDTTKQNIIVVSHDAYKHGAQILALNIGRTLKQRFGCNVEFVVLGDGPMLSDYADVASCHKVDGNDTYQVDQLLTKLKERGFTQAIANTSVSGLLAEPLHRAGINFISLIHELPNLLAEYDLSSSARAIAEYAEHVVFPAEVVQRGFLETCELTQDDVPATIRTQGLYMSAVEQTYDAEEIAALREELGIPLNAKIILNVGFADFRKGFDIFDRFSELMRLERDDYYFVWVGGLEPTIGRWIAPDVKTRGEQGRLILTGQQSDVGRYYAMADAMFLTSREDPFPSVVIEAFRAGLPVVGFTNSGGCEEIISDHGLLVDRANDTDVTTALTTVCENTSFTDKTKVEARKQLVRDQYRFDNYVFDLLKMLDPNLQKVSVVVPNYNYENHIEDRLASIFQQTYPIFEILVLDDQSLDNSVDVIKRFASAARREIKLIVNEENSGNVFRQWKKGLDLAQGQYTWIAEADDVADARFLQKVVSKMASEDAVLGFSDSWQIDENGQDIGPSYKSYINETLPGAFDRSFVKLGREFLRDHLSIKNVILNVSGVIWQTETARKAVSSVGGDLFEFKVAGDWRLYSEVSSTNGAIIFESESLNGHRRHANSVTHALQKQRHYGEIAAMQTKIAETVDLSAVQMQRRNKHLDDVRLHLGMEQPL